MIPQLLLCILTYLSTHFFSSHTLFILLPGKEVKYSLFLQKSFSCNWAAIPNELILHRTLVLQFCHRADAGTNEIISRNFCTLENSKRMVLFPVALYLNLIIFLIFYIKRQPQVSVCQSFKIEDRSRQPRQQKLSQVLEARSSSAWCQQSQALQRGIYFFYCHSQAIYKRYLWVQTTLYSWKLYHHPNIWIWVFPPERIRLELGIAFLIECFPYLVVLPFSPSDVRSVFMFFLSHVSPHGAPSSVLSNFLGYRDWGCFQ